MFSPGLSTLKLIYLITKFQGYKRKQRTMKPNKLKSISMVSQRGLEKVKLGHFFLLLFFSSTSLSYNIFSSQAIYFSSYLLYFFLIFYLFSNLLRIRFTLTISGRDRREWWVGANDVFPYFTLRFLNFLWIMRCSKCRSIFRSF